MSEKEVLYENSDGIATVTLNRPAQLNAWTAQMNIDYCGAMAEAEEDGDVRVVILTGAGDRGFCAGADMSLLSGLAGGEGGGTSVEGELREVQLDDDTRADFRQQFSWPMGMKKPVICAVNGAAVGLGIVHTLYCDVRFASETAKFSTTFAQRGLIAEYGLAWLLPRIIGRNHAMDMLLTARIVKAAEAKSMGLVSEVYAPGELMDRVREYAGYMVEHCSPRSMAIIKKMTYNAQFESLEESCQIALSEMADSIAGPDFMEGVSSFLEKRKPAFPSV
ncbi:MAG TPA: enoyl-CoA hydratase [Candidatus Hydrogenedentes bacterium]|nr:enoyl-CoA hydratase [Candidatus Hydrogenedentota bacterium]